MSKKVKVTSQLEKDMNKSFPEDVIIDGNTFHARGRIESGPDTVYMRFDCAFHDNVATSSRCKTTMSMTLSRTDGLSTYRVSKKPHAVGIRHQRIVNLENIPTAQPFQPFDLFRQERLITLLATDNDVRGSIRRFRLIKAEWEALSELDKLVIILSYLHFQIFHISFTFLDDIYLYLLYLSL